MHELLLIFHLTLFGTGGYDREAGFDRDRWIAEGQKPFSEVQRQVMYPDALAEVASGMTETDVIARLGEPTSRRDTEDGKMFIYHLGYVIIDYEWLEITFDTDGRLIDARHVQG